MHAPGAASSLDAGQFMNLEIPGDPSQILRIPLSFSRADAGEGTVQVEYAVVGDGTRRLSLMRPGDRSTVIAPCGRPWRVADGQGRSVVVAGGIGITPIVACARELAARGVPFDAVVGAQSGGRLWGGEELVALGAGRVEVTTDDGSVGTRGFVTAALGPMLADGAYDVVYACGPQPMMAGVAALAADAGVACQVSMERMMSCAFGACGTCNVALAAGGYASACMDGPVFDATEVAW